ncbi:hypothetical protein E2C01_039147 [Portunus trituberculatus]|uniref:Uncharacterized protein n=1 Tax=Portunus trituberculatus TaxID=210409 RepID=A0A5B7FKK7_PORTR|nr:hypothetical protein [Portunus trituberculatus]
MDAISLQEVALTLLKNLGSSSRSTRDRGREPDNHSETAAFSPSPGKFKPRKFAKTDVVATVHPCLNLFGNHMKAVSPFQEVFRRPTKNPQSPNLL